MSTRKIVQELIKLNRELKTVPDYNFMKKLKINKKIESLKALLKGRV